MTIGYSRTLATVLIVLGGINLILSIWMLLLNGRLSVVIFSAILVLLLGIQYRRRPFFAVEPSQVVLYTLLGSATRVFPYTQLRIEANQLIADYQGQTRRIPVHKWMSSEEDWARLAAQLD